MSEQKRATITLEGDEVEVLAQLEELVKSPLRKGLRAKVEGVTQSAAEKWCGLSPQ